MPVLRQGIGALALVPPMNWHAAAFGFAWTLGVLAVLGGAAWGLHWAEMTFGPFGALVAAALLLAAGVGIAMGVSER